MYKENKNFISFSNKIWLSTPTMHGEEMRFVKEAYDTNWMSTLGKNIDEIEKNVCEIVGCENSVALSCGTAALHLAVKLAGVQQGDKVFCSDMTFAATLNSVVYEKAEPVFIDTEYETWNMCPNALEKAFEIYPDVKVVVLANLYGTPSKFDEILSVCKKHGAFLVEDAAESFGATYKGKQTGKFGDIGVISFNGNKIITGSSGGMFLTDNKAFADKARKWSTQSRDNAPWYQHTEIGYNYRMSNVIAGVVRGQLPYLEEHISLKKKIYERYKNGFKGLPVTMNPYEDDISSPNFWLSCMIIDRDAMCYQNRSDTVATYTKESGKSCPTEILEVLSSFNAEGRPIWKPMHMQPMYKGCAFVTVDGIYDGKGTDVGADIFARGLCLPSDIKMTEEEQDKIIEIVRSCFE